MHMNSLTANIVSLYPWYSKVETKTYYTGCNDVWVNFGMINEASRKCDW